MTDRSKLLALAEAVVTRDAEVRSKLIAHVTSAPGWVLPEPQAAVSIDTAVAFALAFADAEAAAMRERAETDIIAKADMWLAQRYGLRPLSEDLAQIRALPATGEVRRG